MAGRLTGCVLALTCLLAPQPGMAQNGWAPSPGGPAMPGPGMPGALPPAGWESRFAPALGPGPAPCPPGYGGGFGPGYGGGFGGGFGGPNAGVQHAGYHHDGGADYWNEPSPLETVAAHYLRNGMLRVEYMNWDIEQPGDTLLGAPMATVREPREPFPVFDDSITPIEIGEAFVPDLSDINLENNDGIRATWGMPFVNGDFEVSAFWLERSDSFLRFPNLRAQDEIFDPFFGLLLVDPGFFAATSLFQNGELSDTVLLYNQNFTARFRTEVWGTEAIWIADAWPFSSPVRSELVSVRPLIGFQYLDINEGLTQIGVFRDPTLPFPQSLDPSNYLISTIESYTDNDLYGVVLGMRGEFVHEWFTLGAEPRIMLGANDYKAFVATNNLRGEADPFFVTRDENWGFGGVLQLNLYGKIHVHDNFSLFAGYNLLYAMGVPRPDENIYYNDVGPLGAAPPGIVVQTDYEDLLLNGGQIGGEFTFR